MSTAPQIRIAREQCDRGAALFTANRYEEALIELTRAKDIFLQSDARGRPFGNPLPNGVSGLANALALIGRCHLQLGNIPAAIDHLESAFINESFERRRPFAAFSAALRAELLTCYEQVRGGFAPETLAGLLAGEPPVTIGSRFPFSLPRDARTLARLYELAPERFAAYRDFFLRARSLDTKARTKGNQSDASGMRRVSIIVWGVLLIIWTLYGYVVIDALFWDH